MSRWRPDVLALGLSADTLAGSAAHAAAPAGGWAAASLQDALQVIRPAPAGQPARLLLCPDLCKHFAQPPSAGLRALGELRALAALRAGQLFGGPPQAWAVVADWSLTQPMVCAAMPSALLDALRQVARQFRLALSVESAALAALAALSRQPLPLSLSHPQGFVAWASPAHLMLASITDGAVRGLRCMRRPAGAGPAELAARAVQESAQYALRSAAGPALPGAATLVFAWPDAAAAPPAGAALAIAFDAAGTLPAPQPAESEAAWACRLAGMS